MSGRKNMVITLGAALAISLFASALAVALVTHHYDRQQFYLLSSVCGNILEREPEAGEVVAASLKEYMDGGTGPMVQNEILSSLGYRASDFSRTDHARVIFFTVVGFLAGAALFLFTFCYRNRIEGARIQTLTDYLEQINMGNAIILSTSGEDDFSKLEDEIYKTVTFLYQTKDAALRARNEFAENLSNIAHQLKTSITALSLSIQTMREKYDQDKARQIQKQLSRLTCLEEALLDLSRLDSGTLNLQKEEIDVFTLLVLAADNLQELSEDSGTFIEIPEQGEMAVTADLDWTMEAVMNLMKNCMEHNADGVVHCSYEQNLLYTQIRIWDEGKGFAKEDIPHLFERFYRGRNAHEGGLGIGLSLAKEIIERQNGTIRAANLPQGGAYFEIRIYRH